MRQLVLDNGPLNLLVKSKPHEESSHRKRQRTALERYLFRTFKDKWKFDLPLASLLELIDFLPAKRPHHEKWFQKGREEFLCLETPAVDRSQGMADLMTELESFYAAQLLEAECRSRLAESKFVEGPFRPFFDFSLKQLLKDDFGLHLNRTFVLQDLQSACERKNRNSDPIAGMVLLHSLAETDWIIRYPAILRLAAAILTLGRQIHFSETIPNEFGLRGFRDLVDCDIASIAVSGRHLSEGHFPVDIVTFESTNSLFHRILAVRACIRMMNAFTIRNFPLNHPKRCVVPIRQGTLHFLSQIDSPNESDMISSRKFYVSGLREGNLPIID